MYKRQNLGFAAAFIFRTGTFYFQNRVLFHTVLGGLNLLMLLMKCCFKNLGHRSPTVPKTQRKLLARILARKYILSQAEPLFAGINFFAQIVIFNSIQGIVILVVFSNPYLSQSLKLGALAAIVVPLLLSSFVIMCIPDSLSMRWLLVPSAFFTSLALFLIGPLSASTATMDVGLAILSLGNNVSQVNSAPYSLKSIEDQYPQYSEQFVDLTASLYTILWSLGYTLAPLIGEALFQSIGFELACITLGVVAFAIAVAFLVSGFFGFQRKRPYIKEEEIIQF